MRAGVRVDGNGGLLEERRSGRSGSIPRRLGHTVCILVYDGLVSGFPSLGVEEVGLYTLLEAGITHHLRFTIGAKWLKFKLDLVHHPPDLRFTISAKWLKFPQLCCHLSP